MSTIRPVTWPVRNRSSTVLTASSGAVSMFAFTLPARRECEGFLHVGPRAHERAADGQAAEDHVEDRERKVPGWQTGHLVLKRSLAPPRWLDLGLRSLTYILLALLVYVVVAMPVPQIHELLNSPYGLVADVKMLNFFREMGRATAIVLAVLVLVSLVVKDAWCRYLCPYGAMMGLVALASPARIIRNADACIDCSTVRF